MGLGLALPLLLAACAARVPEVGPGMSQRQIEPEAAILYPGTLTVLTSDGGLCVAMRPRGAAAWSGRFQGCRATLDYAVARPARGAREVLAATGEPDGAAVVVEGQSGVWAYGVQ